MKSRKWTLKKLKIEAKKYKSRSEFEKSNSGAYSSARRQGVLDVVCSHMKRLVNKKGYWTKGKIIKEMRKFKTVPEFRKNSGGAYSAYLKYFRNEINIKKTLVSGQISYKNMTLEEAIEISSEYSHKAQMQKELRGLYSKIMSNGWDEDCFKHFINKSRLKSEYTRKYCKNIIQKFDSIKELRKEEGRIYVIALEKFPELLEKLERSGHRYKRAIYIYEFDKKNVYVGLTYNYDRRYWSHHNDKSSQVYKSIKKYKRFEYFEQGRWMSPEKAAREERAWVDWYKRNDWYVLNIATPGSIGGSQIKWTKELSIKEAKKYKTRKEFREKSPSAYSSCKRQKITIEAFSHMAPASRVQRWTKEECIKAAKKAKTQVEFKNKYAGAYGASKRNGWDDVFKILVKTTKPQGFWKIKENCLIEARKYKSRSEFKAKAGAAYSGAKEFGLLEEVFGIKRKSRE